LHLHFLLLRLKNFITKEKLNLEEENITSINELYFGAIKNLEHLGYLTRQYFNAILSLFRIKLIYLVLYKIYIE